MEYVMVSETPYVENQDCALVFSKNEETLLVLADGAGGLGGGLKAAQWITTRLKELKGASLCQCLIHLDSELYHHQEAGESTALVIKVRDQLIFGASVGDSEAWLIKDHTAQVMTENQFRKPLLGSGRAAPVPFGPFPSSGVLLLASDGLVQYTSVRKIIATIEKYSDLSVCAQKLISLVRYPSGCLPDDVTLVLCRLT